VLSGCLPGRMHSSARRYPSPVSHTHAHTLSLSLSLSLTQYLLITMPTIYQLITATTGKCFIIIHGGIHATRKTVAPRSRRREGIRERSSSLVSSLFCFFRLDAAPRSASNVSCSLVDEGPPFDAPTRIVLRTSLRLPLICEVARPHFSPPPSLSCIYFGHQALRRPDPRPFKKTFWLRAYQ
jgi:hypothetical protein